MNKFLIYTLSIFFIIGCSKNNQNGNSSEQGNRTNFELKSFNQEREFSVFSAGIGTSRDEATLAASTFLAQQLNGVLYEISNNKIVLKTPKTFISGGLPLYYRELDNGNVLCIMKTEKIFYPAKEKRKKYFEKTILIPLRKLLISRENFYISLINSVILGDKNNEKFLSGRIFINGIKNLKNNLSLNDKISIKLVIFI